MTYRIYTQNKGRAGIERIVGRAFPGFSIFPATGYWQGTRERSLVIEILGAAKDGPRVRRVAQDIKTANNQEAVPVERIREDHALV